MVLAQGKSRWELALSKKHLTKKYHCWQTSLVNCFIWLIDLDTMEIGAELFQDLRNVGLEENGEEKKILYIYRRHVVRMEEVRSAFKILKGKPTWKRPLRRPRHRWEDNIRMDLEEIGINAGNWFDSAQDRNYWRALVNYVSTRS